jgi:class 3 adenylate cyclase
MDFYEVLDQVVALLRTRGRVTYRALKLQFRLDDEHLEALKEELIEAQRVAADEDGKVLVWVGGATGREPESRKIGESEKNESPSSDARLQTLDARHEGERRQLTVMFCDLVDSTALSARLDPEDLREVVRTYQQACAEVISRFEGHIAQYLGDGLLVYFGYPRAHEDDARRAVRAGLEIVQALQKWVPSPLAGEGQGEGATVSARATHPPHPNLPPQGGKGKTAGAQPLQVRIGIHTGLVVVGEIGSGGRHEQLALGETPNIAARLQGLAVPDTVVISAATARLVQSAFILEELGTQQLKGVMEPIAVARVLGFRETQDTEEDTPPVGTPFLVGRDEEVGLLRRRWEQSREGLGQVVLITGEAGIGKTTLVETLRTEVRREGATRITFRCSPYHQNSALYPVIEHLQHVCQFEREDPPAARLEKLERALAAYRFPLAETVPLFAALLSVPVPEERYPALGLTPQQQKQQTHDALAAWLAEETERQSVLAVWEDVQWADPSTLEVLGLAIDQTPTVRMLTVLTFRLDFIPPWPPART